MKTAVEFLEQQFKVYFPSIHQKGLEDAFEQAKEMEKEQIFDAHENGHNYYDVNGISKEQYYNKTYNKSTI